MDDLSLRILNQFSELGHNSLDLHALLEAAGNDRAERDRAVETIERLARAGYLEELGSDFYTLTEKGRAAINRP